MKQVAIITLLLITSALIGRAQQFDKKIDKDSLVKVLTKDLPDENKREFLKEYNSGSEQTKEFLLFMLSMPRSSKNQLIQNIDSNYMKIELLKAEYAKLIPKGYTISIEFNRENKMINTKESVDFLIIRNINRETKVSQEWNLEYKSGKLTEMLKLAHWDYGTLARIKKLLKDANCVSIENGEAATIGFARSGLGKYSYLLFNADLTMKQIKTYNNGCMYIFYKKNIVLEYEGGAAGPQCFPDK